MYTLYYFRRENFCVIVYKGNEVFKPDKIQVTTYTAFVDLY